MRTLSAGLFIVAVSCTALFASAADGPKVPLKSRQPEHLDNPEKAQLDRCPPLASDGNVYHIPEDETPKASDKNGPHNLLMAKWHWDDGKGNDLTVEKWCMDALAVRHDSYLTLRVIQSKKKKLTTIVQSGPAPAPTPTPEPTPTPPPPKEGTTVEKPPEAPIVAPPPGYAGFC